MMGKIPSSTNEISMPGETIPPRLSIFANWCTGIHEYTLYLPALPAWLTR